MAGPIRPSAHVSADVCNVMWPITWPMMWWVPPLLCLGIFMWHVTWSRSPSSLPCTRRLYSPTDASTVPHPLVGLWMGEGGRDHSPQYTGNSGGGGEAVGQPALRSALFLRSLLDFTFLHGPRHTYRPGCHLYEGRICSRGPSPLTYTNFIWRY